MLWWSVCPVQTEVLCGRWNGLVKKGTCEGWRGYTCALATPGPTFLRGDRPWLSSSVGKYPICTVVPVKSVSAAAARETVHPGDGEGVGQSSPRLLFVALHTIGSHLEESQATDIILKYIHPFSPFLAISHRSLTYYCGILWIEIL